MKASHSAFGIGAGRSTTLGADRLPTTHHSIWRELDVDEPLLLNSVDSAFPPRLDHLVLVREWPLDLACLLTPPLRLPTSLRLALGGGHPSQSARSTLICSGPASTTATTFSIQHGLGEP